MNRLKVLKNFIARRGNHTLADLKVLIKRSNGLPTLRQVSVNGFQLLVRTDEHVGRVLYYHGFYDKEETPYLLSQLRPDDICLDIGANVGYYTLLMARHVREVHAFEPIPLVCQLLSTNVALNSLKNVTINTVALSDRTGAAPFTVTRDSAFSSFRDTSDSEVSDVISVSTITLDDYLEEQRIDRVDIIKIDVEGAEGLVIDGAMRVLAERPRLIIVELLDKYLGLYHTSVSDVVERLKRFGYRPQIIRNHQLQPLDPATFEQAGNVVFTLT